ncbi:MAG: hypothetical protein PHR16_08785 [Methylovulum sp.]|nr:hypothetical protein [Methylovulum sp.]
MRSLVFFVMVISLFFSGIVGAAPKQNGSAKAIAKLQMMVKEVTADRDRLKTENAAVAAELEQVKKQIEDEKAAAVSLGDKLNSEIAAQKSSADEIRVRLDNTTAKLHEVIDKYNALNKSKNELTVEHTNLQSSQQFTASELKACESKNIKMYEGAKEVIDGYQRCQNKGMMDVLLGAEPLTQIKNVEFETIIQEYEDKLNKQKFQSTSIPTK